jgi:HK97 family phage prohead protease
MQNIIRVTNRRATVDAEARAVEFVLSTAIEDRAGDTIDQSGWELARYRDNPVVLWSHDHSVPAIGQCDRLRIEGGALVGRVLFATAEQHAFADTIYRLVSGGFINTGSVGFLPLDWDFGDNGIKFTRHELIEFSITNVPMNPQALARAASEGVNLEPLAKAIDPDGKVKTYEQLRAALVDAKAKADHTAAAIALERSRNRSKALSLKIRVHSKL